MAKKTTHEQFMAKLRADPRFNVISGHGEGFIIGGQNPAHPKPAQPEQSLDAYMDALKRDPAFRVIDDE
jgi:hypothetical protein